MRNQTRIDPDVTVVLLLGHGISHQTDQPCRFAFLGGRTGCQDQGVAYRPVVLVQMLVVDDQPDMLCVGQDKVHDGAGKGWICQSSSMDKRQLFGLLCDGQGYPQIELVVSSGTNDLMYKSLLEDQVDVAIANFTDASPGIGQRDFYREQVVLAVPLPCSKACMGSALTPSFRRSAAVICRPFLSVRFYSAALRTSTARSAEIC